MNNDCDKMEGLHNKQIINVPKAEPRGLLCSNNDVNRGSALGFKEPVVIPERKLDDSNINALIGMSRILKKIHVRLVMEGYIIEDDHIYKP